MKLIQNLFNIQYVTQTTYNDHFINTIRKNEYLFVWHMMMPYYKLPDEIKYCNN